MTGRNRKACGWLAAATAMTVLAPMAPAGAEHGLFLQRRGNVEIVSLDTGGEPGAGDRCQGQPASISDDGSIVAFSSSSQNLHPSDFNGTLSDVFLRDRRSDRTILVSKTIYGISPKPPSDLSDVLTLDCEKWSYLPSVSGAGRYVAYVSRAPITNHEEDRVAGALPLTKVFVYDRKKDRNELVSVAKDGGIPNADSGSGGPDISRNGRYVVYESAATDLVDLPGCSVSDLPVVGDPPVALSNCNVQTYLYDRKRKRTTLVTKTPEGRLPNNDLGPFGQTFSTPRISDDGRYVLFGSRANNLVDNDQNVCVGHLPSCDDVYRYDAKRDEIELVSVARTSLAGNKASYFSGPHDSGQVMSSDGRYVAFNSDADDLIPAGDSSGSYVRDMVTGRTEQLTVANTGRDIGGTGVSLSDDGRYASFHGIDCGHAPVPICGSSLTATMVHDRHTGRTDFIKVLERDGEIVEEGVYPGGWALSGSGAQVVYNDDGTGSTSLVALEDSDIAYFVQDFVVANLGVGSVAEGSGPGSTRLVDDPGDSSVPGGSGEIVEARAVHRPDLGDIYLRLDVADLGPGLDGLFVGPPTVSYRFDLTYGGRRYRVTTTAGLTRGSSVLSLCPGDSGCRPIGELEAWWGTVGESVVVTVPTRLLAGEGSLEGLSVSSVIELPTGPARLDTLR